LEAEKERALFQLQSQHQQDMRLLKIQLETIQKETEELVESGRQRLTEVTSIFATCLHEEEEMFHDCQAQVASENEARIASEKAILARLEGESVTWKPRQDGNVARPEDIELIQRLELVLDERKAALRQISADYFRYQSAVAGVASLSTSVSAVDEGQGKRESSISPLALQKRGPAILEPVPMGRPLRHSL
jgi:hypothetical protein